jgi:cytochrome P450
MARSASSGDQFTEDEVVGNTMLLLAGHLPMRNAIGNAVWLLLTDPDHEAMVRRDDPSLLPSAVGETLRYEPPVTVIPRIALEDLHLRDQTIPAGAVVQLSLAAADRDPDRFDRPDVFDPARHPRGVLSFGHGPHGCLGARIAHEQTQIALVLLRRTSALRIDESAEIRWYRNAGNRGPDPLRVTFQDSGSGHR